MVGTIFGVFFDAVTYITNGRDLGYGHITNSLAIKLGYYLVIKC
jgi:hypothetical protein